MDALSPIELSAGPESRLRTGFWPSFLISIAATCIAVGIVWDISWHSTIGRDTFWTPAHMTIYLGGVLAGCVSGWLAIQSTFFDREQKSAAVGVFGARAPIGAWVAIWGALAMLTSAPFDNWWHNAYGLDVKIISPPHAVLGLGMFAISFGALLLVLSRQNREENGIGSGLFVYVGGITVVLAGEFIMEYSLPNLQHSSAFYKVAAMTYPMRLVFLAWAGRTTWPATRAAIVYTIGVCLLMWILPLFPAQPRLAPIFNPVTHMVPPPFPVLLIFPAMAIDLFFSQSGERRGWEQILQALAIGLIFVAVFVPVQWFFSRFMISPGADNWFFGGNRFWSFASGAGKYRTIFWHVDEDPVNVRNLVLAWLFAATSAWIGVRLGCWMRKVQR